MQGFATMVDIHRLGVRWGWSLDGALSPAGTDLLLRLLRGLADQQTLGRVAADASVSYRTAWGILQQAERGLGQSLVTKTRGRGTRLTAWAQQLVELDVALGEAMAGALAPWEERVAALCQPAVERSPGHLRLAASHDIALADWIENGRDVIVDIAWHGSIDALEALRRGECDIAGFHLPASWSAAQALAWGQRWFSGRAWRSLLLMRRTHGLLTAPGNPYGIGSLADVARLGLRLVNRQRGSGTRRMIDELIVANGLSPETLPGYRHEEFTHDAVAAAIACGQADAGVAVEAVARRYDLGFVPLGTDRYCLATRAATLDDNALKALLQRLQGSTFQQRLSALGGYRYSLTATGFHPWEDLVRQDGFT
jgi:putative molybdopterin biosynthesis protein